MSEFTDPQSPNVRSTPLEEENLLRRQREHRAEELERFRICSALAQIEIASCFHNAAEPLFELLGPSLYRARG